MKKYASILLSALLASLFVSGCGATPASDTPPTPSSSDNASSANSAVSSTVSASESKAASSEPHAAASSASDTVPSEKPVVYMTTDISSQGLLRVYEALGRKAEGKKVAVKISIGEPGGNNFLDAEMIRELILSVNGTFVECNTAYGGSRASTAMHKQAAADHGFSAYTTVDIMDENGSMTLPVQGGTRLKENYVGANLANYDFMVVLSHFKGHAMGGFGGAVKNLSIGVASAEGKSWIHSAGTSMTNPWGGEQDAFLESMAEAAKSVVEHFDGGKRALYINVMNKLSVDCDCDAHPADPTMADIGILASLDPVALDQASVDLVYAAQDGSDLIRRMESKNGIHTLEHAESIGFGSREYELVSIDD